MKKCFKFELLMGLLLVNAVSFAATAPTQPTQKPLLTGVTSSKPNIMFNLDNSGSMSWPFLETYSGTTSTYGMRAPGVNAMYYNPNYEYKPRVNADGTPYAPTAADAASGCPISTTTIGNIPAGRGYNCRGGSGAQLLGTDRSTNRPNGDMKFVDNKGWNNQALNGETIGGRNGYSNGGGYFSPIHLELTNPAPTDSFTYVTNCTELNCTAPVAYTIYPDGSIKMNTTITPAVVPTNNGTIAVTGGTPVSSVPVTAGKRSDCGVNATSCTGAQEIANILNWYRYYQNRMKSVSTAVGRALSDPKYDNQFRIGYSKYNVHSVQGNGNNIQVNSATAVDRGVRYFTNKGPGQNWKDEFYNWLYTNAAAGGTTSHNAVKNVGNYYFTSSPWKNDPTSTSAVNSASDLSCRRSFQILISDGAWNSGTATFPSPPGAARYASIAGPTFTGNPQGAAKTFTYSPTGNAARSLYIPYSDGAVNSSNGLADLTALYFWHTDFSTLPNNVPIKEGSNNPTFWQNMTTYAIGWGLTPSGNDIPPAAGGLTREQIAKYKNDWLNGTAVASLVKPSWATGDLNANSNTDVKRVDDFYRAGYTGGGRSFTVNSAAEVERAIGEAADAAGGAGNDAGVAVSTGSASGTGSAFSLSGSLKYTTDYDISNNAGDVKAFALNSNGSYKNLDASNKPIAKWSASARMPAPANRKIYGLSNYNANNTGDATNANLRQQISYGSVLSTLPGDFQALLNANNMQITTDATFVNYLHGTEGGVDINGEKYRSRTSKLGASVNSAPLYVGGGLNMGYTNGDHGSQSAVDGNSDYKTFLTKKRNFPATLFSANNDGVLHVLNAAGDDTTLPGVLDGQEVAAYMPKGSMAKQIELADPGYTFKYVLDGPLVEDDVYDATGSTAAATSSGTKWRHIVTASGGRADKFLYALESPFSVSGSNSRIPGKNNFLWEVNSNTNGYADLGYVSNKSTSGQLDNGEWVTLVNSGHYANTGKMGLYVLNALTGKYRDFIAIPSSYTTGNRGLGGVVALRDEKRRIVGAYAGDAKGNLWRFDLRTSQMKVSYGGKPLFTAPAGQPIFAAPAWQPHPGDGGNTCPSPTKPQCGTIVVVGTGILLDNDDLASPATQQTIYGIWDPTGVGSDDPTGFTTASTSDLVTQTVNLTSVQSDTSGDPTLKNDKYYQVSSNAVDWTKDRGWRLNMGAITVPSMLTNGERVIADVVNLGSSVILTSVLLQDKKSDVETCEISANNANIIYGLDALTGGNKRTFDINGDGQPDQYSMLFVADGGFTRGNITSTADAVGKDNEGNITLTPQTDCTGASGIESGVGGSRNVYDGCGNNNWRRQWRPISKPPL